MTTGDAKEYLSKREIPQLFECLMTGLMYHRPGSHLDYLQECLNKVRECGVEQVRWNLFIEQKRAKTPATLPPINGKSSSTPTRSAGRRSRAKTSPEPKALDEVRKSPLPPINNRQEVTKQEVTKQEVTKQEAGREETDIALERVNTTVTASSPPPQGHGKEDDLYVKPEKALIDIPDVPIVFIMGGPGSGKGTQCQLLTHRYPGWVHLSIGDLIRREISTRGTADEKWDMIGSLVQQGELAPEEVAIELVIENLKAKGDARGYIIEGYPRTMAQAEEYNKHIGKVDLAIVIDCEEYYLQQRLVDRHEATHRVDDNLNAIASRIANYKKNTLPLCKYYDDSGCLVVIEGDRDTDEVHYDIASMFDEAFPKHTQDPRAISPDTMESTMNPHPPPGIPSSAGRRRRPLSRNSTGMYSRENTDMLSKEHTFADGSWPDPDIEIRVKDEGRKNDMPQCPIILVLGGPGSGKGTQCKLITQEYPQFAHVSMGDILRTEIAERGTAEEKWGMIGDLVSKGELAPEEVTVDLLTKTLQKYCDTDTKVIIMEGYPRDKSQVEVLNKWVGGVTLTVLLDCEEYYMKQRLISRGASSGRVDDNLNAIASRITFFRNDTLPVLKHYDDEGKLVVINGDRDSDEVHYDFMSLLSTMFGPPPDDAIPGKGPVVEEIIEPTISADNAPITGDQGNPDYKKELDNAAKPGN